MCIKHTKKTEKAIAAIQGELTKDNIKYLDTAHSVSFHKKGSREQLIISKLKLFDFERVIQIVHTLFPRIQFNIQEIDCTCGKGCIIFTRDSMGLPEVRRANTVITKPLGNSFRQRFASGSDIGGRE